MTGNERISTPITFTHLRFDAIARAPLKLGGPQAGERLRDALAQVMLRATCPETRRTQRSTPGHVATCPVCWLLASDADPGEVRRAYSLCPPIPGLDLIEPGQRVSFVLTLFGQGFRYLPYFVLAVPEMGRVGVGPGRGKFDLEAIWAVNPLAGSCEAVLRAGENVVHVPKGTLDWTAVQRAAELFEAGLLAGAPAGPAHRLQIQFLTPTRLVDGEALVKAPDFGVFFRRLLKRIDDLSEQFACADKRSPDEIDDLHSLADRVRLVEADVRWVDLFAPSGRTGRSTPMGGFVGQAAYRSADWPRLLPWLLLGQATQAGKLAVKGNGVFQLAAPDQPRYWEQIFSNGFKEHSYDHRPAPGG